MKAICVFPKQKKVQLMEVESPNIQTSTQVKLKILEVGICGTDKEICAFQYGIPPNGSDYLILGHESLGEVVEVGSQVTQFKPGDLVVTMVRRPCSDPECQACRAGRQDFCFTGQFQERGIKQQHGFMTEWIVDEEKYMNKVPASLRPIAVLTEPLTIAEKAIEEIQRIQQRFPWTTSMKRPLRAVVLGAGPVGLLGAMVLIHSGFETYVYSREAVEGHRAKLIQSIGGKFISALNAALPDLVKQVGGIDLVYEATGASKISFELIPFLGVNSTFVFTGVPGRKGPILVDTDLLMRDLVLKNQLIFGTVNAGKESYQSAIAHLEIFYKKWPEALPALITGKFSPEQYENLLLKNPSGIKNLITFSN